MGVQPTLRSSAVPLCEDLICVVGYRPHFAVLSLLIVGVMDASVFATHVGLSNVKFRGFLGDSPHTCLFVLAYWTFWCLLVTTRALPLDTPIIC